MNVSTAGTVFPNRFLGGQRYSDKTRGFVMRQPGRSRRNGSWYSTGNRVSDGWAPIQASPDRRRAKAVKSDWPVSRPAPTPQEAARKHRRLPRLDRISSVVCGCRIFSPLPLSSRSEGSARGEKMLGGSSGGVLRRTRGSRDIGGRCRDVRGARRGLRKQKTVTRA
jgi:hypothetical protein